MPEDHYEVLGVDPDADEETILAAYKDLLEELKEAQPADAEARFERAQRAHDVLTDDERRAAYDRRRERGGTSSERQRRPTADGDGVDVRVVAGIVAVLLLVVLAEAYLVWGQSQRIDELETSLAASEERAAALEANLSETRDALKETNDRLQETRQLNKEYEVVVDKLKKRTEDYIILYRRCDRERSCSTLGVEQPIIDD